MATINGTSFNDNGTVNNGFFRPVLTGTESADLINGFAGNDILRGLGGNDTLNGGDGFDTLDGGIGIDTMRGGQGGDTYIVDNTSDVVIEVAGEGLNDRIESSVNISRLADNVEYLILTGITATLGTGNASDNTIFGNSIANWLTGGDGNDALYGNAGNDLLVGGTGRDMIYGGNDNDFLYGNTGNDFLDGGTGADTMVGGTEDDYYVVDHIFDDVRESLNEGIDGVTASINYTLGNNVENLRLIEAAITGTGNTLKNQIRGNGFGNVLIGNEEADTIIGENGNDTINGGSESDRISGDAGNDILTGGTGFDKFVYSTFRPFVNTDLGIDTITDFAGSIDKICLDKNTFTALRSMVGTGLSDPSDFAQVTTDTAAAISNARIVYNSTNGKLFYNQNGSVSGFASSAELGGHFITLTGNPVISSNDFCVEQPTILI